MAQNHILHRASTALLKTRSSPVNSCVGRPRTRLISRCSMIIEDAYTSRRRSMTQIAGHSVPIRHHARASIRLPPIFRAFAPPRTSFTPVSGTLRPVPDTFAPPERCQALPPRLRSQVCYNIHMSTVSLQEFQRDPDALLNRVEAGEHLVMVRGGRPVAELRPVPATQRDPRPFGLCAGAFKVPDDFDAPLPEEILQAFEGR